MITTGRTQQRQDEDLVEVELQDVRFPILVSVHRNRVAEHLRVAGRAGEGPLAGRDQLEQLAEDASVVVLVIDPADHRSIATVEDIIEKMLAPLDSNASLRTDLSGIAGGEEFKSLRLPACFDQPVAVALVDAEGGRSTHSLPPFFRVSRVFFAAASSASKALTFASASATTTLMA